jgi:TRAP-type C4-dicarboxylate transport system substrate-binding protein
MHQPARLALTLLILLLAAAPAAALDVKLATMAPDGTSQTQALREASREIAQRTDHRVDLKIYPGGVMGGERMVLRKLRYGQLQGAILTGGAAGDLSPAFSVLGLPMLFRDYAEADAARTAVEQDMVAALDRAGYYSTGVLEIGFIYFMSRIPLRSVADIREAKPWVREGNEIARTMFQEAGASPVPLPIPDVLTALQTGLIDTVANSPVGAIALQWFTQVRYLTKVPVLYAYATLVLPHKALNRLSPADAAVVREVLDDKLTKAGSANREDNAEALQALASQGVEIIHPDPAQIARLQAIADETIDRLAGELDIDTAMLRRVRETVRAEREQGS